MKTLKGLSATELLHFMKDPEKFCSFADTLEDKNDIELLKEACISIHCGFKVVDIVMQLLDDEKDGHTTH